MCLLNDLMRIHGEFFTYYNVSTYREVLGVYYFGWKNYFDIAQFKFKISRI